MPSPKRKIGNIGEDVACTYLQKRGYFLLIRNYWKPWGEIDIVAQKDASLRFIEVKSISRGTLRPEENMHPAKLKRLHRAIQTYLIDYKVPENTPWQIDLVCVWLDFAAKRARIEILENVLL